MLGNYDPDAMDPWLRSLREVYYARVDGIASAVDRAVGRGDRNARYAAAEEYVDQSEWVVFSERAELVAIVSDHRDAISAERGLRDDERSDDTMIAYCAMRADVRAALDRLAHQLEVVR